MSRAERRHTDRTSRRCPAPIRTCTTFQQPTSGRVRIGAGERGRRSGFTLVELSVVLAVIGIFVAAGFTSAVLLLPGKLMRAEFTQLDRIKSVGELAGPFRDDLSESIEILGELGEYRSGSGTLILQPSPEADPSRSPHHVIWRWDGQNLWRITQRGQSTRRTQLTRNEQYRSVSFSVREEGGKTIATMERELWVDVPVRERQPVIVVQGVLGADCR